MRVGILPETGYVRLPQILAVFPVSRSAWYEGIAAGRFPKPHKLGLRTAAWRVEDVRAVMIAASAGGLGGRL
ncbi:MAG: AlpA family phage regulatory protein [Chromatiales bacterium]|nr:AlpA family phage regulatory protein [Chromatiales bacterium]